MSDGDKGAVTTAEKWDHAVENALRKTSVGFVAGLLPAVVFARKAAGRAAILFAFTGFGAGMAYGEALYLFDHDVTFDRRHFAKLTLFPAPEKPAAGKEA